jgi:hypothetical protein
MWDVRYAILRVKKICEMRCEICDINPNNSNPNSKSYLFLKIGLSEQASIMPTVSHLTSIIKKWLPPTSFFHAHCLKSQISLLTSIIKNGLSQQASFTPTVSNLISHISYLTVSQSATDESFVVGHDCRFLRCRWSRF